MLTAWNTLIGEYLRSESERENAELERQILALYEAKGLFGQGRAYPMFTHGFEAGSFAAIDIRPALGGELWDFLCNAVADYLRDVGGGHFSVDRGHFTGLWPNVNQRGEFHRPHRHNPVEHLVVGTYYVSVPPSVDGREGALSLMDPRGSIGGSPAYRRFYSEGEICLQPAPGYLVLFPPHLFHYVSPHTSAQPRVSISFNVSIDVLSTAVGRDAARVRAAQPEE